MKLTSVVVRPGGALELERDPAPSHDWQDEDAFRWLNVENATHEELEGLFNQLGTEGRILADHITGEDWMEWMERESFYLVVPAAPLAWLANESWFHLVVAPRAIVCVHANEIPGLERFIRRHWLDRPGPEPKVSEVLLHVALSHVEEDVSAFSRIRLQVASYASLLARDDERGTVEKLEELMTRCHHLATANHGWELLLASFDFTKSKVMDDGGDSELFHRAAQTLPSVRDGIHQFQLRLRELQLQHSLERQAGTEARMRVLTILSAVFLPLTLLAGIYGMNFDNMPELHWKYSYFAVLLAMAVTTICTLIYFARTGWFK